MTAPPDLITLDDVRAAAAVLAGAAARTPVVTSRTLDARLGATVLCKAECLQRTGSFKIRGATNRIAAVDPTDAPGGVLAYSSGNHAQAVAAAAAAAGLAATILMPHDAPAAKVEATLGYGAAVERYDRYRDDRAALAADRAAELGAVVVPPYDDPLVMAGQGTVALELWEDAGPLDVLVVPVGGGGLAAGCATAAKTLSDGACRVVGVEPSASDDTRRSLHAGHRVRVEVGRTVADGQQLATPGELTFEVVRRLVDDVVVVDDDAIVEAVRFCLERMKVVVEPSGASALAALLAGALVPPPGGRVGVVLSGGNVGWERLGELARLTPRGRP